MNDLELAKIERRIYSIRGVRVILDADLAVLYGVSTKRLNEQFRRNRKRFPDDFAFQLTAEEASSLRSQFATASLAPSSIRSQIATSSGKSPILRSQIATSSSHGGRRYRPWAFTEHGALQAANILNSANAVHMSVFVIRAFVKMREQLATNAAILKRLAEIDKELLVHDSALRDIYQKLLPLLSPPPDPPPRKIGFHPSSK
jgi:hypothetical protein